MDAYANWTARVLEFLAVTFVFAVGLVCLIICILFIIDKMQTGDAIRRNYPVLGRFRHIFTTLGEFFRQYFFAMDREELPFNRAQRNRVLRATKGKGNIIAFGSTRNVMLAGTPLFVNAAFPPLDEDTHAPQKMTIGNACEIPYHAPSFFNLSGMSYGAISSPAICALSRGAFDAGIWMNTGEGGLSSHHLSGGCDIVYQIGTAKYGVRDARGNLCDVRLAQIAAHENLRMFEIKLSQGAKPGKGGILPAVKVTEEIAEIRGIIAGRDSLSPNRHIEVADIASLLNMIAHVRHITHKPVGIKTAVGGTAFFIELFEQIHARGLASAPDFVTLDGGEGGTGAAPMPLMDLVSMSIREALPMIVDLRDAAGLREQIRIIASGKLINPGDVAWALAVGADFVVSARGFMFALGCIQALKCSKNTCPTGITTHIPRYQKGLVVEDKYIKVARYVRGLIDEVEIIAHSAGVAEPRELTRAHVRIVQADGNSIPLDVLCRRLSD